MLGGHGGMYVNLVTCALSETAADFKRWSSHSNRLYIKELTGVKAEEQTLLLYRQIHWFH